ncbi:MAG: hypothetical protein RI957_1300 [Verrucomicrobiota bacterium]|jgi:membrane-associated protease RseP (regulator of RpoE activity)
MKTNMMSLLALSLTMFPVMALEAPQKIEPLAPNQAPSASPVPAPAENRAVPADAAAPQQEKPVENMPEAAKAKAYLGVGLDSLPLALSDHLGLDAESAALVRVVDPKGPASKAGLKEADVMLSMDGQIIKSQEGLIQLMEKHRVGDEVKIAYIHRGVKQEASLRLEARPDAGIEGLLRDDAALPEDMLRGIPKEMREAIEKNLKALGANGGAQAQVLPLDQNGMPDLQKRVEKMMQGMQMQLQQGAPAAPGVQMKSTLKMMDHDGNIEISRDGDSCEAKVYDKQGELLWSGPYQTPQDKAAVPPPVRDRLEALNLDTSGKGIQLRMMPRR